MDDLIYGVLMIGAVLANAAIFWGRATVYAADDPEMLVEGKRIASKFAGYLCGLMALEMLGDFLGWGTPVKELGTKPFTAFDRLCLLLYVAVLARATWWIYAQDGAGTLARHHDMFRFSPKSRTGVIVLWTVVICLIGYSLAELILVGRADR